MALPPEKLRTLPELVFDEEEHGYRKDQVRRVLTLVAPVADELESLQQRVADAEARTAAAEARLVEATQSTEPAAAGEPTADYDETLRKTLLLAQQTADQVVADANTQATDVRRQAEADAAAALDSARTEAAEIQAQADQARADLDAELAAERARRLSEIAAEADTRLQQVRQSLAEVEGAERNMLRSEVTNLVTTRERLVTDVETLEGHLAIRRETIRQAMQELGVALDDPAKLRPAMPPAVSEVAIPADESAAPLQVDAIDALHRDAATASDGTTVDADAADASPDEVAVVVADDDPDDAWAAPDPDADPTPASTEQIVLTDDEPTVRMDDGAPTEMVELVTDAGADELADGSVETSAERGADDATSAFATPDRAPGSSLVTGGLPIPDPALADTGVVEALGDADVVPDGPLWADEAPADDATPPSASSSGSPSADPFLEELRRVTSDDAASSDDEALHAFFNAEDDEKRGWFGRRKS